MTKGLVRANLGQIFHLVSAQQHHRAVLVGKDNALFLTADGQLAGGVAGSIRDLVGKWGFSFHWEKECGYYEMFHSR